MYKIVFLYFTVTMCVSVCVCLCVSCTSLLSPSNPDRHSAVVSNLPQVLSVMSCHGCLHSGLVEVNVE